MGRQSQFCVNGKDNNFIRAATIFRAKRLVSVVIEGKDMFNSKWAIPAVIALLLALAGQPSLTGSTSAEANAQASLEAKDAATRPARDVATYSEDVRLTNACIDQGGTKEDCICLVQILKYELDLTEYRQAASVWSSPRHIEARSDATRIKDAKTSVLRLTQSPDFGYRCQEARRYFARVSS